MYQNNLKIWTALLSFACFGVYIYHHVILLLIGNWLGSAEFSHGLLIPLVIAYLIWLKNEEIAQYDYTGSWQGFLVLCASLLLYAIGELSALQILLEYALLLGLLGSAWVIVGEDIFKKIGLPLLLFFFAIPIPSFLFQKISTEFQLLSSAIGVQIIRWFGISVFVEGNVIDLGSMQLQVAEACSGLTYLFPLTSVAFICAYLFRAALWKRLIVFLSSIPITILMNSFRIGVIGVLVEYWGKPMAEGFLHDFEGWIVFMGCLGIILLEIWILEQMSAKPRRFSEMMDLSIPIAENSSTEQENKYRQLPRQYWFSLVFLALACIAQPWLKRPIENIPARHLFVDFPARLGTWEGKRSALDQQYIDTLKFEDYLLADYIENGGNGTSSVNLYIAYYASQRQGESIHSPRSCLPGGGWQIQASETLWISVSDNQHTIKIPVNRVLVQQGEARQLVYYWFRQRGRDITDEYQAKWYLLWDSLTLNRTDGALVRLMIATPSNAEMTAYDETLKNFMTNLIPVLDKFIPN